MVAIAPTHLNGNNMKTPVRTAGTIVLCLASFCLVITQTGCLGILSNVMHAVGADKVPPECAELKDSKVAILVMTDQSQYSDDVAARLLTRKLSGTLSQEVKGMTLVRDEVVQQWRDRNGWDNVEYLEMGKGVEAKKLLVVELTNLRLRDGATLYRGRADVVITVYDVGTGNVLFKKEIDEYTYPVNAGQYTSETTEPKFRKLYLEMLSQRIGRIFHSYDFADTIALDSAIASQ